VIAWVAWLLAVIPTAAGLLLLASTWDAVVPDSYGFRGFTALFAVIFASLGAVILARRPGHPIGWVFAIAGVEAGLQLLATEYADYAPRIGLRRWRPSRPCPRPWPRRPDRGS
jgi:hypothetical protein